MTMTLDTSKNKLWISAGLEVSNGKSAQLAKEQLKILQQQTILEDGCIFFDVLQDRDNPKRFTLWEEWINEKALKQHFNQAHTKVYLAQSLTDVNYIEKLEKLT